MAEVEWLYGVHPVQEALAVGRRRITELLLAETRRGPAVQRLLALAARRGIPVRTVSREHLRRLLGHDQHQGVAAAAAPLAYESLAALTARLATLPPPHTLLALDGVTDVGNFAALIRSAAAFGVAALLVPRHRAVGLTPTVAKRSAGMLEHVAVVQVGNLVQALAVLRRQGFWIYGADAHAGEVVAQVSWPERLVLVLGGEERGLRRLVRAHCDVLVRIPMRPGIDSLNVAVAGSILLAARWQAHEMGHRRAEEKAPGLHS